MEALSRTEPMALFICCYFSNFIAPIDALIESSSEAAGAASILLLVLDCIILIYLCGGVYRSAKNNFDSIVLVISILPSIALVICSSVNFLDEPLLMCLSLFRMVKVVLLRSQYKRAIQAIERQSVLINETSSRILLIALQSAIYASTLACIWFAISCNKLERSVCLDGSNWVAEDASSDLMNFSDPASQYFRSLHFVIQTLLTVGYGDIHPVNLHEALFSLVLILSGALFYGYVISCITSLLSSRDITTKLFRHDLTSLRNYLKLRKVEDSVRETYTAYLEFLYARQLGLSEETVLAALPEEISREIKLACCLTCLKSVPFFKMQPNSDSFAEKCVQRLRFVSYGPDSVVCALNSTERVLYLIRSGKVNLISQETRKPILSLIDGDYLGDYHLVFGFPVEVEAVSAGFTEVAILRYVPLCCLL